MHSFLTCKCTVRCTCTCVLILIPDRACVAFSVRASQSSEQRAEAAAADAARQRLRRQAILYLVVPFPICLFVRVFCEWFPSLLLHSLDCDERCYAVRHQLSTSRCLSVLSHQTVGTASVADCKMWFIQSTHVLRATRLGMSCYSTASALAAI